MILYLRTSFLWEPFSRYSNQTNRKKIYLFDFFEGLLLIFEILIRLCIESPFSQIKIQKLQLLDDSIKIKSIEIRASLKQKWEQWEAMKASWSYQTKVASVYFHWQYPFKLDFVKFWRNWISKGQMKLILINLQAYMTYKISWHLNLSHRTLLDLFSFSLWKDFSSSHMIENHHFGKRIPIPNKFIQWKYQISEHLIRVLFREKLCSGFFESVFEITRMISCLFLSNFYRFLYFLFRIRLEHCFG